MIAFIFFIVFLLCTYLVSSKVRTWLYITLRVVWSFNCVLRQWWVDSSVASDHVTLSAETPEATPKTIGTSDTEAKSAETVAAEIDDGAQSIKSSSKIPRRFFPLERSYSEMSIERMDPRPFKKCEPPDNEDSKQATPGGMVAISKNIHDDNCQSDEDDEEDDKEDIDNVEKRSLVEEKIRHMFELPASERIHAGSSRLLRVFYTVDEN